MFAKRYATNIANARGAIIDIFKVTDKIPEDLFSADPKNRALASQIDKLPLSELEPEQRKLVSDLRDLVDRSTKLLNRSASPGKKVDLSKAINKIDDSQLANIKQPQKFQKK